MNALAEAGQIGSSGPVASWINLDLPEALHRFPPQFVKAFGQTVWEFTIPDEERREYDLATIRHESSGLERRRAGLQGG